MNNPRLLQIRDKLFTALEAKTSWGRNELHNLINTALLEIADESRAAYYIYPDGTYYSAEDHTIEGLINAGHSDDCCLVYCELTPAGEPIIPANLKV
jgi:hypothetical protein